MAQFTTTSQDNNIVIGDENDSIKLNRIAPLYTTIPTNFGLTYIGGKLSLSVNSTAYSLTTTIQTIYQFDNVPVGIYIVNVDFELNGDFDGIEFSLKLSNTQNDVTTPNYNGVFRQYISGYQNDRWWSISFPYIQNSAGTLYLNAYAALTLTITERRAIMTRIG